MKKGLSYMFIGHLGLHNFKESKKVKGILNIVFTTITTIVLLISIGLVVFSKISLTKITNKIDNSGYFYEEEANLPPKINEAGTGGLDGTVRKTGFIYHPSGQAINENSDTIYDLSNAYNVEIYDSTVNKYYNFASGGVLEVVCLDQTETRVLTSPEFRMYKEDKWVINVDFFEEEGRKDRAQALVQVEVVLNVGNITEQTVIVYPFGPAKDISIDLTQMLEEYGFEETDIVLEFYIKPSDQTKINSILINDIYATSPDESTDLTYINERIRFYNGCSFVRKQQNTFIGNRYLGEFQFDVFQAQVKRCDFDLDVYELAYGEKERLFSLDELLVYKELKYINFNDNDVEGTFRFVDRDLSPITSYPEKTFKYEDGELKTYYKCTYINWKFMTEDGKIGPSKYSKYPIFPLGTNEKGIDNTYFVTQTTFITLLITSSVLLTIPIIIIITRSIIFLIKGCKDSKKIS